MNLNEKSHQLVQAAIRRAAELRIENHDDGINVPVIDAGIKARGGLAAGQVLAEISAAGLLKVNIVAGNGQIFGGPAVTVQTDHPVIACLASQYAGWKVTGDDFFAMGSGPMRAAAGKEELFDGIGFRERTNVAVGVLESAKLPPPEVCRQIAEACEVDERQLTLLVAPTASLAGTVQVVARSIETAMHKLHSVGFDVSKIVSAWGAAPLPPVAEDDLNAIGRTNDAIIYGGRIQLWVDCENDEIGEVLAKVPSNSSSEFGRRFIEIFEANDRDFYKIDPKLFSPGWVRFNNLRTGRTYDAGVVKPDVIRKSFLG